MEKIIFKVKKFFGNVLYGIADLFIFVWGFISQIFEEIRECVMVDEFTRELFIVFGFLISPRKIFSRIFRFNAGELILFLIGWGMVFSWFMITMIQHVNQSLGLVILPLGPIMYIIAMIGIMVMTVVFSMQAERFAERAAKRAKKHRQNYAEFLEKYPQTN